MQKVGRTLAWIIPGATLALLPKCPACLAGYIALATGLGISVSAASSLHWSLIAISTATLIWLITRRVSRFLTAAHSSKPAAPLR